MTVPRRLPRTQSQRIRNIATTHASLSGQGMTASARPVTTGGVTAQIYQPEPWTQTYGFPGELVVAPGTARIYNDTPRVLALQTISAAVTTPPAGGGAVVLGVKINGSTVVGLGIYGPGSYSASVAPRTFFRPGDYITVDIVEVGVSEPGADLTVQIRAV